MNAEFMETLRKISADEAAGINTNAADLLRRMQAEAGEKRAGGE